MIKRETKVKLPIYEGGDLNLRTPILIIKTFHRRLVTLPPFRNEKMSVF